MSAAPSEQLPLRSPATSFRHTVVVLLLIAVLLLDWQPDFQPRAMLARRREQEPGPLPAPDGTTVSLSGARRAMTVAARPLPGPRQAARRRPPYRG